MNSGAKCVENNSPPPYPEKKVCFEQLMAYLLTVPHSLSLSLCSNPHLSYFIDPVLAVHAGLFQMSWRVSLRAGKLPSEQIGEYAHYFIHKRHVSYSNESFRFRWLWKSCVFATTTSFLTSFLVQVMPYDTFITHKHLSTYIPQVNFQDVEKVEWLNKVCHSVQFYEICVYCL